MLPGSQLYVQAAEKWAQLDAGAAAARCAHQAALVAVQLRLPDVRWLDLAPDSARQLFVEQPGGFAEALTVAQAYGLMDPLEWVHAVWNQVRGGGLRRSPTRLMCIGARLSGYGGMLCAPVTRSVLRHVEFILS